MTQFETTAPSQTPQPIGIQPTRLDVMTVPFRGAFVSLNKKSEAIGGGEGKFEVVALFQTGSDLGELVQAYKQARYIQWDSRGLKPKFKENSPFKKQEHGAAKGWSGYSDDPSAIAIKFSSKYKPKFIFGGALAAEEYECYSGAVYRAFVTAFAYDHPRGSSGVMFSLQAIEKLADGDRLGGLDSAPMDVFRKPAAPIPGLYDPVAQSERVDTMQAEAPVMPPQAQPDPLPVYMTPPRVMPPMQNISTPPEPVAQQAAIDSSDDIPF